MVPCVAPNHASGERSHRPPFVPKSLNLKKLRLFVFRALSVSLSWYGCMGGIVQLWVETSPAFFNHLAFIDASHLLPVSMGYAIGNITGIVDIACPKIW